MRSIMHLDPKYIVWLFASFFAIVSLSQLMRKREAKLVVMLRDYVDQQLQWARKKAKATRLARQTAREKAAEEAEEARIAADPTYDRYNKYEQMNPTSTESQKVA